MASLLVTLSQRQIGGEGGVSDLVRATLMVHNKLIMKRQQERIQGERGNMDQGRPTPQRVNRRGQRTFAPSPTRLVGPPYDGHLDPPLLLDYTKGDFLKLLHP